MDEKPIQLLADRRRRISMKKGKPERQDSEYVRKGTCSIFLFTEPLNEYSGPNLPLIPMETCQA